MNNVKERLGKCLEVLKSVTRRTSSDVHELFAIHNECFPKVKEYGTHCASCRERVYKRMLEYYGTL